MNKLILPLSFLFLLSGCVSLRTVSLTSIPAKRDNQIQAEAHKYIILAFSFDNDFVDSMTRDLKSKCPNGVVSGILTKDETTNYFLGLFWKHRVVATGYCSKGTTAKLDSPRRRNPSAAPADESGAEPESKPETTIESVE